MTDPHLLEREIARRKTFAIISHPDAGKTTLTEKLLLYGGRHPARRRGQGQARPRAHTVSDWMEMERERGISIASSVLQFPYKGRLLNLRRHARPRRLQRGHLPHADGDRRGHHAARQRQGRRAADEEALPRLQACGRCRSSPSSTSSTAPGAIRSISSARSRRCSGIGVYPITWPICARRHVPRRLPPRARHAGASSSSRSRTAPRSRRWRRIDLDDPRARARRSTTRACKQLRDEIELLDAAGDALDQEQARARRGDADVLRQRHHELRRCRSSSTRSSR